MNTESGGAGPGLRNLLLRIAGGYAVASWLIVQIANTLEQALELPSWLDGLAVIILLSGFPLVLTGVWALRRDTSLDADKPAARLLALRLGAGAAAVTAACVLGFGGWTLWGVRTGPPVTVAEAEPAPVNRAGATIAVLPFTDMSPDQDQEYFSDGISEELLNTLARSRELRVAARTSSFRFKGGDVDVREIGRQLGVAHLLEGSVRRSGDTLRITAQLIETETGFQLWSEAYEREWDDIFAVQDEIAAAIINELQTTLGFAVEQAAAPARPEDLSAYTAYLRGHHLLQKRTKADIEAAIPFLGEAGTLEPEYAPAPAAPGLAWYFLRAGTGVYGDLPLETALGRADPYIDRALEIDPRLADAHAVRGLTYSARLRWTDAADHYETALALNPSLSDLRNWYALALRNLGRFEESLVQFEEAYRRDPMSPVALGNYALELLARRRQAEAEPVIERLRAISPVFARITESVGLMYEGDRSGAAALLLHTAAEHPDNMQVRTVIAQRALASLGLYDEAEAYWPYPGDTSLVLIGGPDIERVLAVAERRAEQAPSDPGVLSTLAHARFDAGDRDGALAVAEEVRELLGPDAADLHEINILLAVDAWERGDEAALQARLAPLAMGQESSLASGADISAVHWPRAITRWLEGDRDGALWHARRALAYGDMMLTDRTFAFPYRHLGWSDDPDFAALTARYEALQTAERRQLLTLACGDTPFETWTPSAATCAEVAQG
ncbi:MAG: tetratricopeptide repeat protein [Oceanicaulis sp.]